MYKKLYSTEGKQWTRPGRLLSHFTALPFHFHSSTSAASFPCPKPQTPNQGKSEKLDLSRTDASLSVLITHQTKRKATKLEHNMQARTIIHIVPGHKATN